MQNNFGSRAVADLNFAGRMPQLQMSSLPADLYEKIKNGQLQDCFDDSLFDSWVILAGTLLTTGNFPMFSKSVGTPRQSLNDATTWVSTLLDTNMKQSSVLAADETFWARAIEISLSPVGVKGTTYLNGRLTNLAGNGLADPMLELKAAQDSLVFTNKLGNKEYEQDRIAAFPSSEGQAAAAGAGAAGDYVAVSNNGFGRERNLAVWHEIRGQQTTIGSYLSVLNAYTPLQTTILTVKYRGLRFRSVQ